MINVTVTGARCNINCNFDLKLMYNLLKSNIGTNPIMILTVRIKNKYLLTLAEVA